MIDVTIITGKVSDLKEYSKISCRFKVSSVLEPVLQNKGLAGIVLEEKNVSPIYEKDYDEFGPPARWGTQWNLSNWGQITALFQGRPVGGCLIAYKTKGVHMLEDREDMTVLWDIRIAPAFRGQGIGTDLFEQAVGWSKERQCRSIKIETQNINVAACRFYAKQGCELRTINRSGYKEFPDEVQLIWHKEIQ